MKCTNCNEENAEGMKFCSLCGTLLPAASRTDAPAATSTQAPAVNYEWYTDVAESDIYDLKKIILESRERCIINLDESKFIISFPSGADNEMQKVLKILNDKSGDVIKFLDGNEPKIIDNKIEFILTEDTGYDYIETEKAFTDIKIPFSICEADNDGEYHSLLYVRKSADSPFEYVLEFDPTVMIRKDECYPDGEGNTMLDEGSVMWDENGSSCTRYVVDLEKNDYAYVYMVHTPDLNKEKVPVIKSKIFQYNFKPDFLQGSNQVIFGDEEENPTLCADDICDVLAQNCMYNMEYMKVEESDVVQEGRFYYLSEDSVARIKDLADMTGRRLS